MQVAEATGSDRHVTYHRLVNTTPNPRATKKRRGELVGPPPPPFESPVGVAVADAAGVVVDAADIVRTRNVGGAQWRVFECWSPKLNGGTAAKSKIEES